jgi:Tfp pilus assembly protein PilV
VVLAGPLGYAPRMRGRHRRSLTLLELLIAISVLVVILLAFASALFQGAALDALSVERTAAMNQALCTLEDVTAEPWASLLARNGETFDVNMHTGAATYPLPPGGALAKPGSVVVVDLANANLRRVEVTVTWRSRTGGDVTVSLVTLVSSH